MAFWIGTYSIIPGSFYYSWLIFIVAMGPSRHHQLSSGRASGSKQYRRITDACDRHDVLRSVPWLRSSAELSV